MITNRFRGRIRGLLVQEIVSVRIASSLVFVFVTYLDVIPSSPVSETLLAVVVYTHQYKN
jgi:hypothetical protein